MPTCTQPHALTSLLLDCVAECDRLDILNEAIVDDDSPGHHLRVALHTRSET